MTWPPKVVPMRQVPKAEYLAFIQQFPERLSSRTGICEPPQEQCVNDGTLIGRIVLYDAPDPYAYFIADDPSVTPPPPAAAEPEPPAPGLLEFVKLPTCHNLTMAFSHVIVHSGKDDVGKDGTKTVRMYRCQVCPSMAAMKYDAAGEFIAVINPVLQVTSEHLSCAEEQLVEDRMRLRELAAQIQTEEQFDAILATEEDPEVRDALRTLLIPMLSFEIEDPDADDD